MAGSLVSLLVLFTLLCSKPPCTSVTDIGKIGQMLRRRMNGHQHSINTSDNTKPVGAHISQIAHAMGNLQLSI